MFAVRSVFFASEKDDKGLLTCSPRKGIPEAGTSCGRKRALKKTNPKPLNPTLNPKT